MTEVKRLRNLCAEMYQVVGFLAVKAGMFNTPQVERVLDNLVAGSMGAESLPHKTLLPIVEEWSDADDWFVEAELRSIHNSLTKILDPDWKRCGLEHCINDDFIEESKKKMVGRTEKEVREYLLNTCVCLSKKCANRGNPDRDTGRLTC